MMSAKITHSEHYNEKYYNRQKSGGAFGGRANKFKFEDSINSNDILVDFGCGGGFLLANIECKGKIGIEPNSSARDDVINSGAEYFSSAENALSELGENYADVIISNHALEHTHSPLLELKVLHKLLKIGGKIHFVVPFEGVKVKWKKNDINYHLYTWSPMNLGNIFTEAGFKIERVAPIWHKWPPKYHLIAKISWNLFGISSRIWARLRPNISQIEVVAVKSE